MLKRFSQIAQCIGNMVLHRSFIDIETGGNFIT